MFHTQWASRQAFVFSFSRCHSGWWLRLHLQSEFRTFWQREVVEKLQRATGGWPKWSGLIGTARDLMVRCGLNCSLQLPNELYKRWSLALHGGAQWKNESLWSQVWDNTLPPRQQEKTFPNEVVKQPSRCSERPWSLCLRRCPGLHWAKPQAACSNFEINSAGNRGLALRPPEVPPKVLF